MFDKSVAKLAIVRVGDGRGFVVETSLGRLVITAGHCLPHLPEAFSFPRPGELVYTNLLGLLGGELTTPTECYFVDPISDIAVVGPPDDQEFPNDWRAYDAFTHGLTPLPVSDLRDGGAGHMLSLDGDWLDCSVLTLPGGGPYWIERPSGTMVAGMTGSPLLSQNGTAIGVVCTTSDIDEKGLDTSSAYGPNPRLSQHLPGWLLHQLNLVSQA